MPSAPPASDVLTGLLWLAALACAGAAAWRWSERRPHARAPWALFLPLGMAVAVPVMLAASPLLGLDASARLVGLGGAAALAAGVWKRGVPGRWAWRSEGPEALAAAVVLVVGAGVLAKPMLNYDVLSYHLPLAHWVAESGWWATRPGDFYSRLPLAGALLMAPARSGWAEGLWGEPGIRVLLWGAMASAAALCARLAGHCGARPWARAAAGAAFVGAAMPWAALLNAHSDVLVAALGVAAAERLLARGARRPADAALAGLLAGTAAAVKFSALGIVVAPLALAGVALVAGRVAPKRAVLAGAAFALGVALALGPWLGRSTVIGGHPLHPFAGKAPGWTAEQGRFVVDVHEPRSLADAAFWRAAPRPLAELLGPTLVLRPGDEEGRGRVVGNALLVPLTLGLVLGRRRRGLAILLGAAAAGGLAWGLAAGNPVRFMLPVLCWTCAAAGAALGHLRGKRPALVAGGGVLGLAMALAWLSPAGAVKPVVAAMWAPTEDWLAQAPVPPAFLEELHRVVGDDRVVLLFDAQGRLYPRDQVGNTVWDAPPWAGALPAAGPRDAQDFAAALRATGARWVLVNEFELGRLVDFYGGLEGPPRRGRVGARSAPGELEEALAAWPPARWGGFDHDGEGLAAFLRERHARARLVAPAGPSAELWLAPLE